MTYATEELAYAMPGESPQSSSITGGQPFIAKALFLIPVIVSGISYIAGGIPPVTDISFIILTLFCLIFLIRELKLFPRQQGIGAVLLYGGVLVWFCHDYLYNWLGRDFTSSPFSATIVAKAAFYHMLFIEIAIQVMDIPFARWADKLVVIVPEPANNSMYLIILLAALAVGISPFFLFAVQPFWEALYLTFTFRGDMVQWTVHRTFIGHAMNVNYDWGGYVAQIFDVGQAAGIFGVLYALMIARNGVGKAFGWLVWFFWVAYAFPGMRRGEMALMVLPAVGLLYYKYQVLARIYVQRLNLGGLNWKTAVIVGSFSMALFIAVQYEGAARDNDTLQLFKARGDTMFSEDMKGWEYFPDKYGGHYFFDTFPGEVFLRPIPDILFWFATDPIPRALWTSKPIDPFVSWNNSFVTGEKGSGANGTTIAGGAVGAWYFRFGPVGIVEGAMVFGWFLGVSQRALRRANGKPLALMFALAFATALFRCYRDLNPHIFDPVLMAALVIYPIVRFFGAAPSSDAPQAIV